MQKGHFTEFIGDNLGISEMNTSVIFWSKQFDQVFIGTKIRMFFYSKNREKNFAKVTNWNQKGDSKCDVFDPPCWRLQKTFVNSHF